MFLSQILIHSFIIMLYIVEKTIFVVIVYKLSVQKKSQHVKSKTALKLMANKNL